MRAIFISYRRNDAEGEAGRLFDDLVREFGDQSVFMDVSTIQAGRDFRKVIDESIATCGVLLAIIGLNWVDAKNDAGERRLDDPADFVRLETASALKREIPVIPVLVRGAKMPRPEVLPDDLKDLAYRNGVELTHARWNSDVQLLVRTLHQFVDTPSQVQKPSPVPKPPFWKTKAGRASFLTGVVAAAAIGVSFFLVSSKSTVVPDVRGNSLNEAAVKLGATHLSVGMTKTQIDPSKEPDTVLSQSPSPNVSAREGTKVDLVLSPSLVEVPAVVGKSLDFAEGALHERQLFVGDVQHETKDGASGNTVLREFPPAGESARPGSKVDLVVAEVSAPPTQGKEQQPTKPANSPPVLAHVPYLTGRTLREATADLEARGLGLGSVTKQTTSHTTADTVLSQSIAGNQWVQPNSKVDLVIAAAPKVVPITLTAFCKPCAISPGATSGIYVTAKDPDGNGIADARISLSAGGGNFGGGGGTKYVASTDPRGLYRTMWTAPQPLAWPAYILNVEISKDGFQTSSARVTVTVSQSTVATPARTKYPDFAGTWEVFADTLNGAPQQVTTRGRITITQDGGVVSMNGRQFTITSAGTVTDQGFVAKSGRVSSEDQADSVVRITFRVEGTVLVREVIYEALRGQPWQAESHVYRLKRVAP